ncbi:imidazolonepropionase [Phaeobacter sp. QD34_3]|uniref:imidazolonepropionase n=1 Tax=unclassified Phaeobacter TaxID=2621772 RepID=UPI00237FA8FE|nr:MULTISPECIES: imidazolonepropionase [unclassified Phaeobacter]MDE4134581.1 imidazolonepropionase [Phaeobacter sp. QD34_3]MDE4138240.1 imidazolonepropionase [Phaeobacter sp. QD34_24]
MDDASPYVLIGGSAATMALDGPAYGLIPEAALAVEHGSIAWVGPEAELPGAFDTWRRQDLEGRLITPALIDCHTHLVFAGDRAREFEMRLNGATYEELARAGGGIASTVAATRAASEEELIRTALPRLDALIAEGVSTVEVKSGYGLDRETELTMLRAARRLGELRPVTITTTFLGAHAVPPEYEGRAEAYLSEVCLPTLRAAHGEGLVDAVDGFCENIAFLPSQIDLVFQCASELGLPVKLHAEQLSHQGGTALAARHRAQSVDHLEYATEADAIAMAEAGSVATILPGAYYTIRETQAPPIALFRKHGVPMALATDCNPGSSPMTSLLMAMNMGCTLFRMTPEEALAGVTSHAARALGLRDRGQIAPGLRADLAVWDVQHPAELSYRIGFNPLHMRIFGGQPCCN